MQVVVVPNATQVFRTVISWKDGKPEIGWEPDLNEGGTKDERVYRKSGKVRLTDKDRTPIARTCRWDT